MLKNLNIHHIGHAAIRIRRNSTFNTVQYSTISYTGLEQPENGEGIYVGASVSNWDKNKITGLLMPDLSNNNKIINNYFGPFVSSESVDIKEGSNETYKQRKEEKSGHVFLMPYVLKPALQFKLCRNR